MAIKAISVVLLIFLGSGLTKYDVICPEVLIDLPYTITHVLSIYLKMSLPTALVFLFVC